MNRVLHLDRTYDLHLSMMWHGYNVHEKRWNNHGISGHVYEIIDYYLLLREYFKVGILLCEDIDWEILYNAIIYKYDIDDNIIDEIKQHTTFYNRPKIVRGKNILFVDGGLKRGGGEAPPLLVFNNIICVLCVFNALYVFYKPFVARCPPAGAFFFLQNRRPRFC